MNGVQYSSPEESSWPPKACSTALWIVSALRTAQAGLRRKEKVSVGASVTGRAASGGAPTRRFWNIPAGPQVATWWPVIPHTQTEKNKQEERARGRQRVKSPCRSQVSLLKTKQGLKCIWETRAEMRLLSSARALTVISVSLP